MKGKQDLAANGANDAVNLHDSFIGMFGTVSPVILYSTSDSALLVNFHRLRGAGTELQATYAGHVNVSGG